MLRSPDQVGTYVPVEVVYPGVDSSFRAFKDLVRTLSLTDSLIWCGRLNLLATNPSLSRQYFNSYLADTFLNSEERSRANEHHSNHPSSAGVLCFRGQLLELLRWIVLLCHDHTDDGLTFNDPEVRRRFFKAAMMASDIWSARVQEPYFNAPIVDSDEELVRVRDRALGGVRASVEGTAQAPPLWLALGRAWSLYGHHLRNLDSGFEPALLRATGLTVDEYLLAHAALQAGFEDIVARMHAPNNVLISSLDFESAPAIDQLVNKLKGLEGQTVEQLKVALWGDANPKDIERLEDAPRFDHGALRERPILIADQQRAIVIDGVFLKERLLSGPLFVYFNENATSTGRVTHMFGTAFERYACEILENMFPTSEGLIQRLSCNVRRQFVGGERELFDACLNDGQEVVLFEVTAKFLRDDTVLPRDPADPAFLEELKRKYESKLAQLVEAIVNVVDADIGGEYSSCQVVFPVLLVYDRRLTAPLIGNWFHRHFLGLLEPGETRDFLMVKGRLAVAPLTVMPIDALEHLETSVREFGFRDLLRDYAREEPNRVTPLWNFIAASPTYNQRMRTSTLLERYEQDAYGRLEGLFRAV